MRAAWVLPSLEGGGAEKAIATLLPHLPSVGISPELILLRREGVFLPEVAAAGVPIHSLAEGSSTVQQIPQLRQLLHQLQPEVTVGVLRRCAALTAVAHRLARLSGPFIFNEQNLPSQEMRQYGRFWLKRWGIRPFYQLSHHLLAISAGIRDDLITHFEQPPDKISVIPNPVDATRIRQLAQQEPPHPWLRGEQQTIVSVGRLHPQKGHDLLLQAFAQLTPAFPALRLLIVGEGDERPFLTQLITNLQLTDRVALVGFQTNPYPWMAHATLFALASRYEGFGNVLAEALTLGVPTVATDCPSGPADILAHGKAGWLLPVEQPTRLAQTIANALSNPAASHSKRAAGLAHVARYDVTAVAQQSAHLFQQLTDSQQGTRVH